MLKFNRAGETTFRSWRRDVDPSPANASVADISPAAAVNASDSHDTGHAEPMTASPYSGWYPKSVAGRLRRAWRALVADPPWPAMHAASNVYTTGILVYFVGAIIENMWLSGPLRQHFGVSSEQLISQIWIWGAGCLIPVLAGARMGSAFPRRGALGTFFALSIMALLASPFFLCFDAYARSFPDLVGAMFHRDTIFVSELVVAAMCSGPVLAGWLVIGGFAALFTGIAKRLRASEKRYVAWFANGLGAKGSAAVTHFLDAAEYHLKSLAEDTQRDIRNELRQHIEALTAAHEELGVERDEATASALRQFGDPQTIARRFCRAWEATAKEALWPAFRAALKSTAGAILTFVAAVTLVLPRLHLDVATQAWITWPAVCILPMIVGARIGLRFPRAGARATFYATSLVALAAAPVCYFGLTYGGPNFETGGHYLAGLSSSAALYLWQVMIQLVVNAMTWPATASLSAAVAGACSKVQDHLRMTNA